MASEQQKVGGWSPLPGEKPTPEVQSFTSQVKQATEQKMATNFARFEATLYRRQTVAGTNYVVKVDTGAGDDKYVHVKMFVSLPPQTVEFKAAEFFKKDAPLEPQL